MDVMQRPNGGTRVDRGLRTLIRNKNKRLHGNTVGSGLVGGLFLGPCARVKKKTPKTN